MPAPILQLGCQIMCPHGGQCMPVTKNSSVTVGGGFALLSDDQFSIVGCTYTLPGPVVHPCLSISWSQPAEKVKVNGSAVLLQTSTGQCKAADQTTQGMAIVSAVQSKVMAT